MIQQIPIGGFDKNFVYFVGDGVSPKIAIVDPANVSHLLYEIEQSHYEPAMILLTHSHYDHVKGVEELVEKFAIPVYMHPSARQRVGISDEFVVEIEDGGKIKVGDLEVKVMHTPGHIDDSVCYLVGDDVITGDTLFVEGCGRADFDDSSAEALWESLQKLMKLSDDTKVYSGHDYGSMPVSTIKWEKENNRFLLCESLAEFKKIRLGK